MKTRPLIAVALVLATSVARADTPPLGPPILPPSQSTTAIGTLGPRPQSPLLTFAGAVDNPTPLPLVNSPFPVVCAAECQEFSFNAATTQPFIASVHSTLSKPGAFNPNDGFDLYVYGPDKLLEQSAYGIGADGQSVIVPNPAVGTHTLVVTFTFAQDPDAKYTGEVRLMRPPTWQPPACTHATIGGVTGCFNLPVLRALPAYDVAVTGLPPIASTPLGFPLPLIPGTPTSCYIDETLGLTNPAIPPQPANITRCLRFTSDVQNAGAGRMEVRLPWLTSTGQSGFIPGQCHAEQVVTTDSGVTATRPAGDCLFHLAHAHFHYKDLISYTLYQHGTSTKVGVSQKASFCLADDEYFGYGTAGPNGPRDFVGQPGCNVPSVDGNSLYVHEGITPGWGDVYTWDTPDQFIDISNTPPGTYDLVMRTNPNSTLLVAGPQQTCALTVIDLTASTVKVTSTQASIACP